MYVNILFVVESKQGFMLNIITIYRVIILCEPNREKENDMNMSKVLYINCQ